MNDISQKLNTLNEYELFECRSAFNGFAIYRTSVFKDIVYDGTYDAYKTLISEEEQLHTLTHLHQTLNIHLVINEIFDCCEHLFYHVSAIQKNNARIRISKLYPF